MEATTEKGKKAVGKGVVLVVQGQVLRLVEMAKGPDGKPVARFVNEELLNKEAK